MIDFDRTKSLAELEGSDWGEPEYDSRLISECHRLRNKRLCDFTVEDLRIMIGQGIGLAYLVPMALGCLEENPLIQGDMYPGDLLQNVLRIDHAFWRENRALKQELDKILKQIPPVPEAVVESLIAYNKMINE